MPTVTTTNTAVLTNVSYTGPNSYYLINRGTVDDTKTTIVAAVDVSNNATVLNAGRIAGIERPHYYAIRLGGGGAVTNTSQGVIGAWYGVAVSGAAGTVVNAGTITGQQQYSYGYGPSGRVPLIGLGVQLDLGGTITNQAGGLITAFVGAKVSGGATVVNAGSINGSYGGRAGGGGLYLYNGGQVTNQSTGTITGNHGIRAVGPTTITNYGRIASSGGGQSNYGITVSGAAAITNELGGTLTGFDVIKVQNGLATIVNAGDVYSTPATSTSAGYSPGGVGIDVIGGSITNTASGVIGGGAIGILAHQYTSIVNAGTITFASSSTGSNGILLAAGGVVENQSTGRISGFHSGVYLFEGLPTSLGSHVYLYGPASISNAGTISGNVAAIALQFLPLNPTPTGVVSNFVLNEAGGLVIGGTGVATYTFGARDGLTLENAGTVTGTGGHAVSFDNSRDALIVDQGAVFNGSVDGGGGALVAGTASSGTLAGLGTQFTNFSSLTIDSGQTWTTSGTFVGAGVVLGAGARLTNGAGGHISGVTASAGPATLENAGTIDGGSGAAVVLGAGGGVVVDQGAAFVGTVNGGGGTLTLGTASRGYLTGLGTQFTNFSSLNVEAGQTWTTSGAFTGSFGSAVLLGSGAALTNSQGGLLTAVYAGSGPATLENAGTIQGSLGLAVSFASAGTLVVDQTGTFVGLVDGGGGALLLGSATAGVLVAPAQFVDFFTLSVRAGQSWTVGLVLPGASGVALGAGASLTVAQGVLPGVTAATGSATVDNAALISTNGGNSPPGATGVLLRGGGAVTNRAGAAILGASNGVAVYGGTALTTGTVLNAGTIVGGYNGSGTGIGVLLVAPGGITNVAGGRIVGALTDGVVLAGPNDTLTNAGTIEGARYGVNLLGGTATNLAGGSISGAANVVENGTVENAGTISGTGGMALTLMSSSTLIVDQGAVFNGQVVGGGGTLDLGTATAGTITGLGTQFTGFTEIVVEAGDKWFAGTGTTLASNTGLRIDGRLTFAADALLAGTTVIQAGHVSIATGTTVTAAAGTTWTISSASETRLSGPGTFSNDGALYGNGGNDIVSARLMNAALVQVNAGSLTFGNGVVNTGTMVVQAGALLEVSRHKVEGTGTLEISQSGGTLDLVVGSTPGQHVDFLGGTGLVELGSLAGFKGEIAGFAAGDSIDLLNTMATGFDFAHGRLGLQDNATALGSVRFTGGLTNADFQLASDGHGGTLILHT